MSQKKHMTKAQLDECKALFGPAPVLSTEDVAHFETIFDRVANCLEARPKWPPSALVACDTMRFA